MLYSPHAGRRPLSTVALAAAVLTLLAAGAAHAQTLRPEVYVTNGTVSATAVSDDGQTLYIGGNFTYVGPNTGSGARLSETAGAVLPGSLLVNGTVSASAADGAGGFYIGGSFTTVGGVARNRIAHILSDGTLDAAFDPSANSRVLALTVSGGVVYAGGEFTSIGRQPRNSIAALDAATGLATAFNPNATGQVLALAVSGGVVYAGGDFATIGGQMRNNIAGIDAATGLATAFNPSANSRVSELAVSGSVVYAGGFFRSIGGQTRNLIAGLDASTGLATAFNPNADDLVNALAVSGGVVYAGGNFSTIGGQTRNFIAGLDAATGIATAFNPNANAIANGQVLALAVSGGVVYAGGSFTSIGGQTRNFIAGIDPATGLATAFDPSANGNVLALAVSGGVLYAGGEFGSIGGRPRQGLAVFSGTPVASEGTETSVRAVSPVYPNPALGRATLAVSVPQTERVRVDVYNVLGQYVLTAFDGPLTAGATQSVTIETSRLAAGIYVIRVQGASFAETRRLTVVR